MANTRFQSFSESSRPDLSASRLAALRAELVRAGVAGLLLPRADIFQGEYLPPSEDRLAFLTGFTGSAGFAIVLARKAALFVDGRYTVQARAQTDPKAVKAVPLAEMSPEDWLAAHAPRKARIGYVPDLFTPRGLARFEAAAATAGLTLVALSADPVAAIWPDRPAAPASPVVDHPLEFAGEGAEAKIARVQARLVEGGHAALVVSECPSVNWLFNLRAADVPHIPILRAFALVPATGKPTLFVDPKRLSPDLAARLAALADIVCPVAPPGDGAAELEAALDALHPGAKVRLDADSASLRFRDRLAATGRIADLGADPIARFKAVKNETERAGARAAQTRDGAAMVRFLAALDRDLARPGHGLTEIEAVRRLEACRIATGALVDLSFSTISAAGPNAALPHYRVTEASNRAIEPGLYLVDSGGQYRDGTTDITRTLAVGKPTRAMKLAFTRVLKGMIAMSRAVFPIGTSGAQLDAIARWPLWQAGQDFDHGTGHGVGSFLSVHEGPQRLSKLGTATLEPGMILSNEPGYYREGKFGIRIENLVLVEPRAGRGFERKMLGFETLTLCPIDRRLIVRSLLDRAERGWLDAYHARVRNDLGPLVDPAERDWLDAACRPI